MTDKRKLQTFAVLNTTLALATPHAPLISTLGFLFFGFVAAWFIPKADG